MKNLPVSKISSLALLLVLPFFLTACTLSDLPVIGKLFKGKDQPVSLKVWGLWEPAEVMAPLIEDYRALHPNVTVEYEARSFVSLKSYKESVFTRLQEGTAPNVLLLHNSWVGSLVSSLAPAPDEILSIDAYNTAFYPVARDSAVFDNKVYAVPLSYDGLALIYNKDMFTEAGISAAPATWEEFRTDALKLTKKSKEGVIEQAGAAIGTANNIEHFSDILGLFFAQSGVAIPQEINSQAAADALTFYTTFVTTEKVWNDTLPPSAQAFADKKVAMIFVPSWQLLNILGRNDKLNIGVAQVPKAIDATTGSPINIEWGSFWMNAVAKNSTASDAAWDFVKFLSEDAQARKLFSEQAKIRAFGEPYALKSLAGELSGSAYLSPYMSSAANAKSAIIAGQAGNDREVDSLRTAVNSVLGGTTAAEALSAAQKEILGQ